MAKALLVVIEQRDGEIKKQSLQTLSKAASLAKDLGSDLNALIIGSGITGLADEIKEFGVKTLYLAEADHLAVYNNASYALAVEKAVSACDAGVVLLSATAMGKDLSPLVAAKLNCGALSDVTAVDADGDTITVRKPIYAGKCFATFKARNFPVVLSLRPNVFTVEKDGESSLTVENLAVEAAGNDPAKVTYIEPESKEIDVAEASVIVSGGRGLKEAENFKYIRELADTLGAAVGASRAVVDADWISHKHQVGQTGKTVSPNLYFAFGISGAIQHLAGMSSSKLIVAVNKDADAPIFKVADFGLVGDMFTVIEKITAKLKAGRE